MLRIKQGVSILGLKPEALLGIVICSQVFKAFELDCILTSVVDSKHGRGSLHYVGFAFDLRSKHVPSGDLSSITVSLKRALGKEFDVILEGNHFHIEYQPKVGVNRTT